MEGLTVLLSGLVIATFFFQRPPARLFWGVSEGRTSAEPALPTRVPAQAGPQQAVAGRTPAPRPAAYGVRVDRAFGVPIRRGRPYRRWPWSGNRSASLHRIFRWLRSRRPSPLRPGGASHTSPARGRGDRRIRFPETSDRAPFQGLSLKCPLRGGPAPWRLSLAVSWVLPPSSCSYNYAAPS